MGAPLPSGSSCAFCVGTGWVCADPSGHALAAGGCDAEDAPCVCNPKGAVEWRSVFAEMPPDEPAQ